MLVNIDFTKLLAYQQDKIRIKMYLKSQNYLNKRVKHSPNYIKLVTNNLLSSLCLYKSFERANNS